MPKEIDDDVFESYDDDVDLNPKNKVPDNRTERFKGEQGRTYRVALMYFHPLAVTVHKALKAKATKEKTEFDATLYKETLKKVLTKRAEEYGKTVEELADWEKLDTRSAQFKRYNSQFKDGVGVVVSRLGQDGAEADKFWGQLGNVAQYQSTVLLVYPTDRDGNTDEANILRDGVVKPWRIAAGTFNTLITKNKELGEVTDGKSHLANTDLRLKCKNTQWQNFDMEFAGASLWLKNKEIRNKFLPLAYKLYGDAGDKLVFAKTMSTPELMAKLNQSGGGDSGSDVSEDDMSAVLEDI